jgi:hypothetical protein
VNQSVTPRLKAGLANKPWLTSLSAPSNTLPMNAQVPWNVCPSSKLYGM